MPALSLRASVLQALQSRMRLHENWIDPALPRLPLLRIVLGVIGSVHAVTGLAWQQRQIDGRDQVGHQIQTCITVVVNLGNRLTGAGVNGEVRFVVGGCPLQSTV